MFVINGIVVMDDAERKLLEMLRKRRVSRTDLFSMAESIGSALENHCETAELENLFARQHLEDMWNTFIELLPAEAAILAERWVYQAGGRA